MQRFTKRLKTLAFNFIVYNKEIMKSKNKIRPIYRGPLSSFQKWVNIYRLNGRTFHTEQHGSTAYIIDKHSIDVFIDRDAEKNMSIPVLCRKVTMDIRKYEINHIKPRVKSTYPIVEVNKKVVESMNINETFVAIDMVACYWNFAYKLGYISKSTYDRGIGNKQARLIAIGNLNKTTCKVEYGKGFGRGKKTYEKSEYSDYWHSILQSVEDLYYSMNKIIDDNNYIAFETDCIYIKQAAVKDITEYLKENKIDFKEYSCYMNSYTGTEFKFTLINSFYGTDKILHCR